MGRDEEQNCPSDELAFIEYMAAKGGIRAFLIFASSSFQILTRIRRQWHGNIQGELLKTEF
jgi:hypothetical protein